MRITLLSDLHFEFRKNHENIKFIEGLDSTDVDVLVLAGDIFSAKEYDEVYDKLNRFCDKYKNVIYVPGNHEFYNTNFYTVWDNLNNAAQKLTNLHILHRSQIEIDGQRFIGDSMWFRDDPLNIIYEGFLNDFRLIKDYRKWVYEENALFEHFLQGNLQEGDVVISHHLPLEECINKLYKNSPLNRFFFCDMNKLIEERKPKYWLHGHSHIGCDYVYQNTRILSAPMGYPREQNFDKNGYVPKLIDLK